MLSQLRLVIAHRRALAGFGVLSLAVLPLQRALRSSREAPQPRYTEIISSDSLDLMAPALSPDGRWVALESRPQGTEPKSLYMIPAEGGKLTRLTSPGYADGWPVWFPSGDRIVFYSTRVDGLMTLRIDPKSGTAVGTPQRLTIEKVQPYPFAVSPDGKEVLYATPSHGGQFAVKAVPASGGTARLVDSVIGLVSPQMYWTSDGAIEFGVVDTLGQFADVVRVTGTGKPVVVQHVLAGSGIAMFGPGYLLRGARVRINADTVGTMSVVTRAGDTVARFDTRGATPPINRRIRFTPIVGTYMLAPTTDREAVHAMSTTGGPSWVVRPARSGIYENSEYPDDFSPDSRVVYVESVNAGKQVMLAAPVHGGDARIIPLPPGAHGGHPSQSGRYLYSYAGHPRDSVHVLYAIDATTGRSEEVSRVAVHGSLMDLSLPDAKGDDRYYADLKGGHFELRRFSPGSGSTLVRTFTAAAGQLGPAMSTGAMAWVHNGGDSAQVYLDTGTGAPRVILSVRGRVRHLVWSPSGHTLAMAARAFAGKDSTGILYVASFGDGARLLGAVHEAVSTPGVVTDLNWAPNGATLAATTRRAGVGDTTLAALFVPLNEATAQVGKTRVVELPRPAAFTYGAYWTPDNQVCLINTGDKAGYRMQVWRVPNREGAAATNIAQETGAYYDMALSPDGKTLSYQVDLPARSTIWRVDLPGLAAATPRR